MKAAALVPRVTVLVPSFNQARFLQATLESIRKASARPIAVHVLDAGSDDGSTDVIRAYAHEPWFRWRSRPDGGVHDAVNEGLAAAETEYCAVQSSDDLFVAGALDRAVALLDAQPDLAVVYGDAELIDADDHVLGVTGAESFSLSALLSKRSFVMQSSAVFRTRLARDVGGFRPDRPYVCDSEMWIRMALRAPLLHVPSVWSRYRIHASQRDRHAERIQCEWWSLVAALRPMLAPWQRRHARVGGYLTEHRYADPSTWRRSVALWRALALDPSLLAAPRFPRRDLDLPLRWIGSRVKRWARGVRGRGQAIAGEPGSPSS